MILANKSPNSRNSNTFIFRTPQISEVNLTLNGLNPLQPSLSSFPSASSSSLSVKCMVKGLHTCSNQCNWDLQHGNYSFLTCRSSMQCNCIQQIYWSHCLGGNSGHDSPVFSNLAPKCSDGLCKVAPSDLQPSTTWSGDEHALCAASCWHQLEEAF